MTRREQREQIFKLLFRVEFNQKEEMPETEETKQEGLHAEILKLKKLGMTEVQIAKKLGIGIGEVRLVNGLYRGESDS